ncbi:transposase family protein [Salmonella enterica]|nr:transposase family protein [Salmonella enterica]ECH3816055.1 transposase family protein [Salmonella enterica]EHR0543005.1 transposase family protein [Salmonella enterica]EHS2126405.1 transposase family protein [Salmonella enterica]EHV3449950.1 transposase family protein [Salmonella enterica]
MVAGATAGRYQAVGDEKIEWLRQYRAYQHGIPDDGTMGRLVTAIEPEKMNQAFIDWVNEVRQEQGHEPNCH